MTVPFVRIERTLVGMAKPPSSVKTFNKLAIRFAGHRLFPLWAVLRHRGRTSGKEYAIPVAVIPGEGVFFIGLPWGRGTDWVRNVRAAGGCTVRWKGRELPCTEPEFVDKDVVLGATGRFLRWVLERTDFQGGFLRLRRPAW